MTRFENIHKNKLCAFIDGALTALLFAWLVKTVRKPRNA